MTVEGEFTFSAPRVDPAARRAWFHNTNLSFRASYLGERPVASPGAVAIRYRRASAVLLGLPQIAIDALYASRRNLLLTRAGESVRLPGGVGCGPKLGACAVVLGWSAKSRVVDMERWTPAFAPRTRVARLPRPSSGLKREVDATCLLVSYCPLAQLLRRKNDHSATAAASAHC